MIDNLRMMRFLILLLAIVAAAGCTAKVEVESARSAAARNRDEAVASDSQTAETARTEIQFGLLQDRTKPVTNPEPPKPAQQTEHSPGTTVILNVHGGDVHVHDDQHRAPICAEADNKATQGRNSILNTKIGWPSSYWQHGPQACTGFVIVWLLVGIAVALMLATVGRSSGGPMLEIIALLIAAATVLQFLPDTESGLQLIPISPWLYSGW